MAKREPFEAWGRVCLFSGEQRSMPKFFDAGEQESRQTSQDQLILVQIETIPFRGRDSSPFTANRNVQTMEQIPC
jgi:hypothetical protein